MDEIKYLYDKVRGLLIGQMAVLFKNKPNDMSFIDFAKYIPLDRLYACYVHVDSLNAIDEKWRQYSSGSLNGSELRQYLEGYRTLKGLEMGGSSDFLKKNNFLYDEKSLVAEMNRLFDRSKASSTNSGALDFKSVVMHRYALAIGVLIDVNSEKTKNENIDKWVNATVKIFDEIDSFDRLDLKNGMNLAVKFEGMLRAMVPTKYADIMSDSKKCMGYFEKGSEAHELSKANATNIIDYVSVDENQVLDKLPAEERECILEFLFHMAYYDRIPISLDSMNLYLRFMIDPLDVNIRKELIDKIKATMAKIKNNKDHTYVGYAFEPYIANPTDKDRQRAINNIKNQIRKLNGGYETNDTIKSFDLFVLFNDYFVLKIAEENTKRGIRSSIG